MTRTHGGKGSGQRARSPTVDRKKFSDNWDLAFSPNKPEPIKEPSNKEKERKDEI